MIIGKVILEKVKHNYHIDRDLKLRCVQNELLISSDIALYERCVVNRGRKPNEAELQADLNVQIRIWTNFSVCNGEPCSHLNQRSEVIQIELFSFQN